MPRIRTLKPSFWTDSKVVALSHEARLLTIGLISLADDEGRFVATPAAIRGYVYPYDHITDHVVRRWRDEIVKAGVIWIRTIDGLEIGYFPHWRDHQRISHVTPSMLPPPP
jgi:hypothetical protein